MSYPHGLHGYGPSRTRRRAWPIAAVVVLVVGALLMAAVVFLPGSGEPPATSAPLTTADREPDLRWTQVGGQPVPVSAAHGPTRRVAGLASGFAHNELGAVLAALHIQSRLTVEVGPEVFETTAREQCFGDIDTAISTIRASQSNATAGSTTPTALFYRVIGGDASGERVLISVAAQTPQASANGGFVAVERVLEWRDGDWRMRVPSPRPQIIASVETYTILGEPT